MADALISIVVDRVTAIVEKQIQNQINLVRGVDKEVLNLSTELKKIQNLLDDADRRGFKDASVKDWLKRLEDMSYEMDDVLDEWEIAILKLEMERHESNDAVAPPKQEVCSFFPSSCVSFKKVAVRHDIAKKIKNIKGQLDEILKEKDRYNFLMSQPTFDPFPKSWRVQSTSFIDSAEIHGRDSDRDILVSKLMSNCGRQEELGIQVLSIVGVGGLGKTTLAQLVYSNSRIEEHFELRIWICASDPFDEVGIAKKIVESVRGSPPNTNNLEMLLQSVRECVSGKKLLFVLDDVWTQDYAKWEPLKNSLKCGASSKILVTTRNERVARMMGTRDSEIYHLPQLSDEDCWLLLCRMALFGRNEEEYEKFQDIGKKIVNKCKGLPLAAKTLGSLLRFKDSLEEWENVLNNEIWQLEEAEVELFPHLLLSYNELSLPLKRCFSYCAIFPKDIEINVERLIKNWMSLGYLGSNIGSASDMELRGRAYFDILAKCSLFQDFKKSYRDGQIESCKMHDIVHDFAQFLRKNVRVGITGMKKTTCHVCNPSLVSSVQEYRSLFRNREIDPPNLCDCLTSLRLLEISDCNLDSIPQEFGNLIHLRLLDLSRNKLSGGELKTIWQLFKLQTLLLSSCNLKEIPWEIGNLIQLRHLDLSNNDELLELPESICGLGELRTLNIESCFSLCGLPKGIPRLINLKHLPNEQTGNSEQFYQGIGEIAQLTRLRTLNEFRGGSGWGKMGWLKNLNHLSGSLELSIKLVDHNLEQVVEDAREAELRKKMLTRLWISFKDELDAKEEALSSMRMDVIDSLQPHPNLRHLSIFFYEGSKLPGWISSPLYQLRYIGLFGFSHMSSLPPLGKLPYLEQIEICFMYGLQFVGREFLGLTTTIGGDVDIQSSSMAAAGTNTIAFPKLKELKFHSCLNWKRWEDITAEEEESPALSIMPCLTVLYIIECSGLTALPHRLLHKASSLEKVGIYGPTQLE